MVRPNGSVIGRASDAVLGDRLPVINMPLGARPEGMLRRLTATSDGALPQCRHVGRPAQSGNAPEIRALCSAGNYCWAGAAAAAGAAGGLWCRGFFGGGGGGGAGRSSATTGFGVTRNVSAEN